MQRTVKFWTGITGLLTAGVGLPYILRLFGPTEREVVLWGQVAVFLGLIIFIYSVLLMKTIHAKRLLALLVLLALLIQIPPIILWFVFNGYGISDGIPASWFVAHWCFSIPHILAVIVAAWCLWLFYKN